MTIHSRYFALFDRAPDHRSAAARAAARFLDETRKVLDAEGLALRAAAASKGAEAKQALAAVEQQIHSAYARRLTGDEARFAHDLGHLEAERAELLSRTTAEHMDGVERGCAVEHARLEARSRPALIAARRTERTAWRALRAFRFRHRLAREARYPESSALHYSALAFVCVIEAIANTFAFSQGSTIGILGGLAQALLVAVVNVVFAFFAGRAASGLFHRNWGIKALGALLVGAWVVFEGLYALTVAHYRIALVADVDMAPWMALERLQTLPFAIDDVTSVLLTVFTIAFGVATLLTGLATDDRYPGFGTMTRAYRRTRERLETLRQGHLGAIDAIYLSAPAQLTALTTAAAAVTKPFGDKVEAIKLMTKELEDARVAIRVVYRDEIDTARQIFLQVAGVPLSKAEPTPLADGTLVDQARAAIAAAEVVLAGFPSRLASLADEKAAAETRLQHRHAAALQAAPAFFALTEQLAETESDHDEADGAHPRAEQQPLLDDTLLVGDDTPEPTDTEDSEVPPPSPMRKGNGAERPEDRAA